MVLAALGCLLGVSAQGQDADELWAEATLYRDAWGVPHVYAATPRGLGFAFGYAQAEDHAEAMLMAYRTANGRAAEVAGERMAASDEFALRMGHARLAARAFEALAPEVAELCTGFAMGVNTWLLVHPESAPPWADGVHPADPLALWHAFVTSMAPLDLPGIERPGRAIETGNAWALAPERTEEGRALLVLSAHHWFDGPFRWYEAHLSLAGMDVYGATLFGLPVIVQGFNGALGWALTPNFADTADVFREDGQVPGRAANDPRVAATDALLQEGPLLEYLSQSQPYYVRTDTGMEERAAPAMLGPRGPVFESGGALYSWAVGGMGEFGAFSQLIAMAGAADLGAFQAALAMHQIPCFNVVYADRDGNVFYLYNAKAGRRDVQLSPAAPGEEPPAPLDWSQPLSVGYYGPAWDDMIDAAALPAVLNPASGFVQACGAPPWFCTDDAPIAAGDYPGWFFGDADTFRARRARQLLRAGLRTFRDMQDMVYDVTAPAAVELAPVLLELAEGAEDRVDMSHPDLETGLELLRKWNHKADVDQAGMTFYHVWWNMMTARHAADFPNATAMADAIVAREAGAAEAALSAAAEAARMMRNDLDTLELPWGDAHRLLRGDKDHGIFGAASGEPLFLMSDHDFGGGKWRASYGHALSIAVEFGEAPEAATVAAFGASEVPASPHFADQLELLKAKRLKRALFAEREVLRYAASAFGRSVTLYPEGAEGQARFENAAPARCALKTAVEAPAPLPGGLAAFTAFVRPVVEPIEAAGTVAVALGVPEALCAEDDLDALALYAHTATGWARQEAERDATGRAWALADAPDAVFVILGPERALRQPDPLPAPVATPVAAQETAAVPADAAPIMEHSAERSPAGVTLRMKGGYVPEERPAADPVAQSDRGVRVLRLRGSDAAAAAGDKLVGSQGAAVWMEGLPKEDLFGPPRAPEAAPPGDTPPVATFEDAEAGGLALPSRLRAEPEAPQLDAMPSYQPPAPGSAQSGPEMPLEGALGGAAAPAAAPAVPAEEAPAEEAPAKERKRKKKKAEEAAPEFQEITVMGPGYVAPPALEGAPPDGFGDTSGGAAPAKESRKQRRDRERAEKAAEEAAQPARNFSGRGK